MNTLHKHIVLTFAGLLSIGLAAAQSHAADDQALLQADGVAVIDIQSECDAIRAMEPRAALGLLGDSEVECLERRLENTEAQTGKEKLSLVLMAQAYASGDKARWAQLVKRHFNQIDRSNADLCYKYALHLFRTGGQDQEVIVWADIALENRFGWKGRTFKSRVNGLNRLRAMAGQRIWMNAVEAERRAPGSRSSEATEVARNNAKVYALEWMLYSRRAGLDASKAFHLCLSASGAEEYCDTE